MKFALIIFAALIGAIQVDPTLVEIEGRIKFGQMMTVAEQQKFNYQVGIYTTVGSFGAGVLIAPDVLLTAGHVLNNINVTKIWLVMGTINKNKNNAVMEVTRDDWVVHEDYNIDLVHHYWYDIAVVKLPQKITLSKTINVIEMALSKTFDCGNEQATAWIAGWGARDASEYAVDKSKIANETMRYAQTHPIPWQSCKDAYGIYVSDLKNLWCASVEKNGVCMGDSGGPYVLEDINDPGKKRKLCGLMTLGSCLDNRPPGFISVPYFLDNGWICKASAGRVGC